MKNRYLWIIVVIGAIAWSCTSRKDRNLERQRVQEELMQEHIDQRIEEYQMTSAEKCQREFFSKANLIVDSILLDDARKRLDTIPKPDRVGRPGLPEILEFTDTSKLDPLFDSLSFEELENQ